MVKTFRMVGVALSLCALVLGSASCKDDDDDDDNKSKVDSEEIAGSYYNYSIIKKVDGKQQDAAQSVPGQDDVITITNVKENTYCLIMGAIEKKFEVKKYNSEIVLAETEEETLSKQTLIKFMGDGNASIIERTKFSVGNISKTTEVEKRYQKMGGINNNDAEKDETEPQNTAVELEYKEKAKLVNKENLFKAEVEITSVKGKAGSKEVEMIVTVIPTGMSASYGQEEEFKLTLGDANDQSSYVIYDKENEEVKAVKKIEALQKISSLIFCMENGSDNVILSSPTLKKDFQSVAKETLFSEAIR